ncbi:MAG: hypothetical protein DRJ42_30575, partial [Deltaproteobacteria bacterium]
MPETWTDAQMADDRDRDDQGDAQEHAQEQPQGDDQDQAESQDQAVSQDQAESQDQAVSQDQAESQDQAVSQAPEEAREKAPDPEGIVRRPRSERKGLDPALEELAAGESKFIRHQRGPKLRDDRPVRLVAGVKNSDVRSIFDARLVALEAARKDHPADPGATKVLAHLLAEARTLETWRGRSLASFDAMVEQFLDMPPEEARTLAKDAAEKHGIPMGELSEEAIAAWMRAEAALIEGELEATVRVVRRDGKERFLLDVDAGRSPEVLSVIGRRLSPLAEDQVPRDRGGDRPGRGGGDRERPQHYGRDGGRPPGRGGGGGGYKGGR